MVPMALTRRAAVAGVGTLLAGGGFIVGTGALSSDPNRSVSIQFADDSAAYLGMEPADNQDRENVHVTLSDEGSLHIQVQNLNANARTAINDLVAFTNNSPRDIVEMSITVDDMSAGADVEITDVPERIPAGEVVTGLGIIVDTRDFIVDPDLQATIRISTVLAAEEA